PARVPGDPGGRRRARRGRQGHRRDGPSGGRRRRHRPDRDAGSDRDPARRRLGLAGRACPRGRTPAPRPRRPGVAGGPARRSRSGGADQGGSVSTRPIRRALLAVYDKEGIVELARALRARDVQLVSSGGTAATLRTAGIDVTEVADVTGFPEMLGGRVKTLHPAIHAGLLADQRDEDHLRQIAGQGIEPFDLLVSNLYPFRETVASGAGFDETIEKIDIGGPAMVRASAKNFESVTVVVNPERSDAIVEERDLEGGITRATRFALAAEAFAHTAAYDAAVAGWFAQQETDPDALPGFVGVAYEKVGDLRYGENPHQRGALFAEAGGSGVFGGAEVLQGKEMSFNNWLDAWAAADLVHALPDGACVIVKHNNPCGVAALGEPAASYRGAFACDEVSAFGGIVAFRGV